MGTVNWPKIPKITLHLSAQAQKLGIFEKKTLSRCPSMIKHDPLFGSAQQKLITGRNPNKMQICAVQHVRLLSVYVRQASTRIWHEASNCRYSYLIFYKGDGWGLASLCNLQRWLEQFGLHFGTSDKRYYLLLLSGWGHWWLDRLYQWFSRRGYFFLSFGQNQPYHIHTLQSKLKQTKAYKSQ